MKKLYIRTFGCQMNEYDSAKMADVLRAAASASSRPTTRRKPTSFCSTPARCAKRRRRRSSTTLGRSSPLKQARPGHDHRRRRLRRQPGRRGDRRARALRRCRVRAADAAPLAAADRGEAAQRASRRSTSPFPKSKSSTPAASASRWLHRFRLDHGRLQQVLHLLRGALHARRGGVAAVSMTCSPKSPSSRRRASGRVTLLGQNVNAYRGAMKTARSPISRCCSNTWPRFRASSASATRPRIRASSRQRLIDAYRTAARSSSSHVHLPVQSGSDRVLAAMKRGYTVARIQIDHPAPARSPARHFDLIRFHRRFPGRDRGRFRADPAT